MSAAASARGDGVHGGKQLRARGAKGGHDGVQRGVRAQLSRVQGLRRQERTSGPLETPLDTHAPLGKSGSKLCPWPASRVCTLSKLRGARAVRSALDARFFRRSAFSRTDVGAAGAHRRAKQRLAHAAAKGVVELACVVRGRPVVWLAVGVVVHSAQAQALDVKESHADAREGCCFSVNALRRCRRTGGAHRWHAYRLQFASAGSDAARRASGFAAACASR